MQRITLRVVAIACLLCAMQAASDEEVRPKLSQEHVVLQLEQGDIEFAFFPEVAPVTAQHIFKLVQLGLYTTNQFFRLDKGFVAQTSDVGSGRTLPLNEQQKEYAFKNVPLEVVAGVKHHAGRLSMARGGDPGSASSSFFICLGDAPHLDMQYGVFGEVTRGMEVLHKLEALPTKREGIFVMPLQRVTIVNSYWYSNPLTQGAPPTISLWDSARASSTGSTGSTGSDPDSVANTTTSSARRLGARGPAGLAGVGGEGDQGGCPALLKAEQQRSSSLALQVEEMRKQLLPG